MADTIFNKDGMAIKVEEASKIEKPQTIVRPDGGLSGYATYVLRDAATGQIKMEGTTKNLITGRGLDWIISHVVCAYLPGGPGANWNTTTASSWHSKSGVDDYVLGDKETNPFAYLCLLTVKDTVNQAATFGESKGNTSYYIHKCMANGGTYDGVYGIDVVTYDERLGDSSNLKDVSTNHNFASSNSDPTTRNKILGSKALGSINSSLSGQSNTDATVGNIFKKVMLVFSFDTTEANAYTAGSETINSIAWASDANCKLVGARLDLQSGIPKTSADTLDITYTFDLAVS